ncbi:MAG TPA: glycoside hydrolase family 25 protein [Streptosporangiaceae bacterium]|nr:glycoside hydrolase family 25 protein [Streptosporangiaceae bacterium]
MARLRGVDVSAYQGAPGAWKNDARFDFAAVKITELQRGGVKYVNPDAAADWAYLAQAGKGRIAYLFAHPSVAADETVDFFVSVLNPMGVAAGDAIAVDLEQTDGLSPSVVSAWAQEVTHKLSVRYGRPVILYTYIDFAREGNCSGLGGWPLWLSDPSSPAGHPDVPAPWKHAVIHQFKTAGAIDLDVAWFPSLAEMQRHLGRQKWVVHTTTGRESLKQVARAYGVLPSTIIRMTLDHFETFKSPLVAYVNKGDFSRPLPPGSQLMVPPANLIRPRRHVAKTAVTAAKAAAGTSVTTSAAFVRAEPVMTAGGTLGVLAALITLVLPHLGLHLQPGWTGAVLTMLTALSGLFAALKTTKPSVTAVAAALGTLATAGAVFGLHLSPQALGYEMPVASLLVALLVSARVSPKSLPGVVYLDVDKLVREVTSAVDMRVAALAASAVHGTSALPRPLLEPGRQVPPPAAT